MFGFGDDWYFKSWVSLVLNEMYWGRVDIRKWIYLFYKYLLGICDVLFIVRGIGERNVKIK